MALPAPLPATHRPSTPQAVLLPFSSSSGAAFSSLTRRLLILLQDAAPLLPGNLPGAPQVLVKGTPGLRAPQDRLWLIPARSAAEGHGLGKA